MHNIGCTNIHILDLLSDILLMSAGIWFYTHGQNTTKIGDELSVEDENTSLDRMLYNLCMGYATFKF